LEGWKVGRLAGLLQTFMPAKNIVRGQRVNSQKLNQAKALRRTMTPAGRVLWQALRANKLGFKFRREQIIDGFIADFYCHECELVVEVDGEIHEKAGQQGHDEERTHIFESRGLRVLRVENAAVLGDLEQVLELIRAACRTSLPGPLP
jgi:very-short-patch-repair endonuclease